MSTTTSSGGTAGDGSGNAGAASGSTATPSTSTTTTPTPTTTGGNPRTTAARGDRSAVYIDTSQRDFVGDEPRVGAVLAQKNERVDMKVTFDAF